MKLCACGCGREIPFSPKHKYREPKYLPGHHTKAAAANGKPHRLYTPSPGEIPSGLCECGCGGQTAIAGVTYIKRRHFRGHPVPFLPGHSPGRFRSGSDSHSWKGGRYTHKSGYVYVSVPDSPMANSDGYVLEHRHVVSLILGRALDDREVVHHKNGLRSDNRPENLELMDWGDHSTEHAPDRHYGEEARRRMSEAGKKGAAARWGKRLGGDA